MNDSKEEFASSENNTKKRKKQKTKKKAIEENGEQIRIQMDDNLEDSEKISDSKLADDDKENNLLQTNVDVQPLAKHLKLDSGSTENLSEGNKVGKKRKRPKKMKAHVTDEIKSTGQIMSDARSTIYIAETEKNLTATDLYMQPLAKLSEMDSGLVENLSEGNEVSKKKKKKKKKAKVEENQSMDGNKMDTVLTNTRSLTNEIQSIDQIMMDIRSTVYISESENNLLATDLNVQPLAKHSEMDSGSIENLSEGNKVSKRKRKKKKKANVEEENQSMDGTKMDTGSTETRSTVKDEIQSTDQIMTDKRSTIDIPESEKNLLATDINVQPLAKPSEMGSGSIENLSEGNKVSKKKRKKKKKANVEEENQSMDQTKMDTGSTETRSTVKDEIQSTDHIMTDKRSTLDIPESEKNLLATDINVQPLAKHSEMDSGPIENLSEGNKVSKKKRKKKKKANVEEENQNMDRTKMDTGSTETRSTVKDEIQSTDQIMTDKRSAIDIPESEKNLLATDINVQPLAKHSEMDSGSIENLSEGSKVSKKKSKKKKKAKVEEENQSMDRTKMDTGSTETRSTVKDEIQSTDQIMTDTRSTIYIPESDKNFLLTDLNVQPLANHSEIDPGSIDNLSEGNKVSKKKRKKKKKAKVEEENQSLDGTKMDTGSTEYQKKAEIREEVHIVDQANAILNLHVLDEIDGCNGSIENLAQVNVNAQTKKKKKKKKTKKKVDNKDDVHIVDQVDAMVHLRSLDEKHGCNGSTENFAEGNLLQTNLNVQPLAKHSGMDSGSMENLFDGNKISKEKKKAEVKEENQSMDRAKIDAGSTECHNKAENKDEVHVVDQVDAMLNLNSLDENHGCNGSTETLAEGNVNNKSKKRKKKPKVEDEVQSMVQPNFKLNSDLSNENHKQGINDKLTENQCTAQFPRIAVMTPIRRKLLVLDINGLLADIVMPAPKDCRGDIHMLGRAIFRRPFYDDFLKFCFQNFDVGIWSSRTKRVIDKVVDYLLGDQKYKLLFCWDMSYCAQTGFKTLDQRHKPLVCKVLQKIWDADFPNLPWKKGDYNETNTLLLDDSPYKALLNPLHTAVFPCSYDYRNRNDKSLGPGGDLRVYLEGLLTCENVQKYVEQHPFGQSAIDQTHSSWEFYSNVLRAMSTDLKVPHSLPTLS